MESECQIEHFELKQEIKIEPNNEMEPVIDPLEINSNFVMSSINESQSENKSDYKVDSIHGYSCDQCDYKTKWKSSLKRHEDSVHGGVRYPCDQCDHKATWKSNLKTHIDCVHGDVLYPCDQCDYKSNRKGHVKRHKHSVHKDLWHSCDQCEYKGTKKENLKTHINSVHGDVW